MTSLLNPYLEVFRQVSDRSAARKPLIWAYSWAVPSDEAVLEIARHAPILEIGAGTGYWGWMVRQAGAEITCMDSRTEAPPHWLPIHKGTPQTASEDPLLRGRALLLVWPPLSESGQHCMALDALLKLRPRTVIHAGEWRGRTGSPEFHAFLEAHYRLVCEIPLPNWPGFHDTLRVYCQT